MTLEITIKQHDEGTMALYGWIHCVSEETGETTETFTLEPKPMTGMSVKERMAARKNFLTSAVSTLYRKLKTLEL